MHRLLLWDRKGQFQEKDDRPDLKQDQGRSRRLEATCSCSMWHLTVLADGIGVMGLVVCGPLPPSSLVTVSICCKHC